MKFLKFQLYSGNSHCCICENAKKKPLVKVYIAVKNQPFLVGKSTISTGPCSIANC